MTAIHPHVGDEVETSIEVSLRETAAEQPSNFFEVVPANAPVVSTTASESVVMTTQPQSLPTAMTMTYESDNESVGLKANQYQALPKPLPVPRSPTPKAVSTQPQSQPPETREQTFIGAASDISGTTIMPGIGLEGLSHVTKFYLHKIGLWECDCRGKFSIFDQNNKKVFYAREDAGCCGLCRLSVLTIVDVKTQKEVIRMVRPCRCLFPYQRSFMCCYGCTCLNGCQDEIQIEAPPGITINHVIERAFCQNMPYYEIQDINKRAVLCVGRPARSFVCSSSCRKCSMTCTNTIGDMECCRDAKMFNIYYAILQIPSTENYAKRHISNTRPKETPVVTIDPDHSVGQMNKRYAFKLRCVAGNDYEISFPADLNNRLKASLLCTAIFVNAALYWD